MTFCRLLSLVAVPAMALAMGSLPAQAQFGGMPGMPGSPGMGGFGGPPAGPPPVCQQLLTMRDETQKNGAAIAEAQKRKVDVIEACKLFKVFLATETKFIQGMTQNQSVCGVPPQAIKQFQDGHAKASLIGKQVCEAAEHPRPTGPSLSDALNSAPSLPDADNTKGGHGTYDTLQGNALTR
ncbi:MAG TPA: hypothetical protein VGI22_10240 [Xanthobacteraceae bacterium]